MLVESRWGVKRPNLFVDSEFERGALDRLDDRVQYLLHDDHVVWIDVSNLRLRVILSGEYVEDFHLGIRLEYRPMKIKKGATRRRR